MSWNLPPGCTQADIDRAFGSHEPEENEEVMLEVRATATMHIHAFIMASTMKEAKKIALTLKSADFEPIDDCIDDFTITSIEPYEEK